MLHGKSTTFEQIQHNAAISAKTEDRGAYCPSAEKIRAECEKIQDSWTSKRKTVLREAAYVELEIQIVKDWRR